MKKIAIIFLLTLSITIDAQEKKITLTGTVKNQTQKTIKLLIPNIFSYDETIITKKIDSKGHFSFEYSQMFPHDNFIEYDNELYHYFSSPGDTISCEINNPKISFKGSHQTLNNEFQSFKIRGEFELWKIVNEAQEKLSPNDYKKKLFKIQAETNNLLKEYYLKNNSSIEFQEWNNYYYKYNTLNNLMRYAMFNREKTLPEDYYDFLYDSNFFSFQKIETPEMPYNLTTNSFNTKAFMSSEVGEVANEIQNFLVLKSFKDREFNSLKTAINLTQGVIKEILITKIFYSKIEDEEFEFVDDNLSLFFSNVKNENLRKIILDKYDINKKEKIKHFSYYNKEEIIAPIIDSILKINKSKVIYIDFWATWCGPCLSQMPYSNKLKETYKEKDVAFVYIGVESPEKTWKSKIDELKIDGQHYLLSTEQYDLFSEIFQINGIPHYVLINKKGEIIDGKADSPFLLSRLTTPFENLLNK